MYQPRAANVNEFRTNDHFKAIITGMVLTWQVNLLRIQ